MKLGLNESLKIIKVLYKTGLMKKMLTACMFMFFAFGVLFCFAPAEELESTVLGGFYFVFLYIYIEQIMMSHSITSLFITSPLRKIIETKLRIIFSTALQLTGYSIYLVFNRIWCAKAESAESVIRCNTALIFVAVIGFGMLIYSQLVFRFYKIGVTLLCIFVLPIIVSLVNLNGWSVYIASENSILTIIISYAILIAGYIMAFVLAKLVYKKPVNKTLYKNALGKLAKT
ncbi:MAG: hypothetical protein MJ131_10955 [Lachnospiraceae bacterium]|nr:hypothetical protein [Lachnospiraceae bacterium]